MILQNWAVLNDIQGGAGLMFLGDCCSLWLDSASEKRGNQDSQHQVSALFHSGGKEPRAKVQMLEAQLILINEKCLYFAPSSYLLTPSHPPSFSIRVTS